MNEIPHDPLAVSKDAAIVCAGLSRSFGEVQALKNLNLSVPYGSIYGFLGRNGAGKTTTIRILAGLAQPSSGSAWVAGIEATRPDSKARNHIGYLPQNPAFYRWMTPIEYLDYAAQLFGIDEKTRKHRISEMLQLVDLQNAAKRKIGGFSGGMVQRLGIAQALIHSPKILFLDEPTSSLDPAGRYEILELIASLRERVTVFFSTHILTDVERICDTVAIIHKGEVIIESDRDDLLNRYAVNTAEIELDTNSQTPDSFVEVLKEQPWVEAVQVENSKLRITVTDISRGKACLLPLVADYGLLVNRLEWVRPSLEEIFLKISA